MSKRRIKGAPFFNELMMFKGQSLKMVCFGERKDQSVHILGKKEGGSHGLRTPNEGINKRYLKNWTDMADKI